VIADRQAGRVVVDDPVSEVWEWAWWEWELDS
jgi:hypothetical protein